MSDEMKNAEHSADAQSSFDKALMLENIKAIAKRKQIPLGQLEQKSGVSAGYLSRQSSGNARIDFGTVVNMAKILNVSMDDLVYKNMTSGLTATEFKIYQFLDKLKHNTHDESVNWSYYTAGYLNSFDGEDPNQFDADETPPSALFDYVQFTNGENAGESVYSFRHQIGLFGYCGYYCEGPTFFADINPYVTLYINQLKYTAKTEEREKSKNGYLDDKDDPADIHSIELFLSGPGTFERLCNSHEVSPALVTLIEELRDEADASTKRVQLSDFSKSVIDGYLDPVNHPFKDPIGKENVPF